MLTVLVTLWILGDPPEAQEIGRLAHPPIREASGIVRSRRFSGTFWVHNDSGNPPALYAVHADGSLVREFPVATANVDWEDLAIDSHGRIYLGEIGNNNGRLPIRAIYRLDEPDPSKALTEPLKVTLASYYRFPEGRRFDAEALIIDGNRAVLVAKTFDKKDAALYAVPLDPPASLLRPATPQHVGTLPGFTEPVTGADLSEDGVLLAVCGYAVARVYQRDEASWRLVGEVRYRADGVEAVCWDGLDLILAGEGRGLYRISESTWRRSIKRKAAQQGS